MNRFKFILLVLLLVPQLAAARVYMCVDPQTGKKSFTDKACPSSGAGEEVKVGPTNTNSGKRTASAGARKTWSSQVDERKTGREHNEINRAIYNRNATAGANRNRYDDDG